MNVGVFDISLNNVLLMKPFEKFGGDLAAMDTSTQSLIDISYTYKQINLF